MDQELYHIYSKPLTSYVLGGLAGSRQMHCICS